VLQLHRTDAGTENSDGSCYYPDGGGSAAECDDGDYDDEECSDGCMDKTRGGCRMWLSFWNCPTLSGADDYDYSGFGDRRQTLHCHWRY